MKRLILFICLVTMVSGARAAKQYREFTNADGKTIRGCIKAYDPAKKMVKIERENKRIANVPITVFSEADRIYILEWDAAKGFMSESLLRISIDKKRVDQRKEKEWDEVNYVGGGSEKELMKETSYESILYEVEFSSRNESDLKNLRLEYIVYYEQSEMSWKKPVVEQKLLKEKILIPLIEGRKKVKVSTQPVEIHRDNIAQKNWVSGRVRTGGEGEIHGFRARVYMKMPSGKEVMREFAYPEKLSEEKFPWNN